jgi:hypothetical protein
MKGYIYTIEVMLAVVTILFMIVVVFSNTPEQPETALVLIKQNGYDALHYMDQSGMLRGLVSRNLTNMTRGNISLLLPASIAFDVDICSTACSSANLPSNRTVVAVDYYIGAYMNSYVGKKVRLWMWELY